MSARPMAPVQRMVVRLPSPLGDAVMAEPALHALRRALPDTYLVWEGHRAALDALAGRTHADGVMALHRDPGRAVRVLRPLRFDTGLLLPNSPRGALAYRRAGIPRRWGTGLNWVRRRLLTNVIDVPRTPSGELVPALDGRVLSRLDGTLWRVTRSLPRCLAAAPGDFGL